ncbi:VOC family protein [Paenarthrobacter sp. NPDC056912]|uniref:VOC family protein n=1 Tax=Paenarthrobacter sp. NPDC056912 TaxID=3345965 RepID=UPI00366F6E45
MRQLTAFSHVGVTVPDIEGAILWYQRTFGMKLLAGPIEVLEDGTELGKAAAAIYGHGFRRFAFAHLGWADGTGIELFYFESPRTYRSNNTFEYWKTGIYHIALTAPNFQATIERIIQHGGRQRSEAVEIDADNGYSIVYCEDPWGTVIELCSHPYSEMWG